jgi:hypothetical protein
MTTVDLSVTHARARLTLRAERKLQIALGVIWLIDGALQLQPFMFGRAFVTEIIAPNETGQPGFVAAPIRLAAHLIEPRVALFNLVAVIIQMLIGIGLIYRRTVKAALLTSFGWALGVWWIGEGLGGLFTGTASPLTGAPGAALLYILAGLIVWPQARCRTERSAEGGLLGEHGARTVWALLWLGSAALWLLPANRADEAVHDAVAHAPSGARWLSSIHSTIAAATAGHGIAIALGAASLSAAVGSAVLLARCAKPALALSTSIGIVYLVIGQGIGGIFTGSGTDPGTGPLIVLLAISLYPLHRDKQALTWRHRDTATRSHTPERPTSVMGRGSTATGSERSPEGV